jgi:hypothetical protein
MLVYGSKTFWASFGWGNVGASKGVYWLLAAVVGLAGGGVIRTFWRRDRSRVGTIWAAAWHVPSGYNGTEPSRMLLAGRCLTMPWRSRGLTSLPGHTSVGSR